MLEKKFDEITQKTSMKPESKKGKHAKSNKDQITPLFVEPIDIEKCFDKEINTYDILKIIDKKLAKIPSIFANKTNLRPIMHTIKDTVNTKSR